MFRNLAKDKKHLINVIAVLIISIIGLYLRFELFAKRNLWGDELREIMGVKGYLGDLLQRGEIKTFNLGDYFLIYPFYRLFGENKWGLGVPHIIITFIGFYLFYIMCKQYLRTVWGYIVAFLIVAFNCNLVFHAFEIRPYGVLANLSIAVFLVMKYIVEKPNLFLNKRKILISLFILLTFLYHLHGSFMLFFYYLFHLLFSRKGKTIIHTLQLNFKHYWLVLILAFSIWFYFVSGYNNPGLIMYPFEYIHKGLVPITKGVFGNLIGFRKFYFLLSGIPIAFLLPHKERFTQIMFFTLLTIAPVSFVLLLCIIYKYWFIQRAFIWVMPPFAFLVGWCWDSMIIYGKENIIKKIKLGNR